MNDRIDNLSNIYYEAREAYEAAKAESDKLERVMRSKEYDLVSAMLDQQLRSFSRSDGTTVFLRQQISCSVIKANYDAIRTWLLQSQGDDSDYVEEIVSKSAVTELVKSKLNEGCGPEDFPAILNVSTRPILNVKGWKGKDVE